MGRCSSNVRDATEAAKGCDSNIQGHIFPSQSSWTGNKRMRALEELHESDGMSHEELMDLREPFVFHFNLQSDCETFCAEITDVRLMKVFV